MRTQRFIHNAVPVCIALFAAFVWLGCSDDSADDNLGCQTNADCPDGQACNAIGRICVPDAETRPEGPALRGNFSCTVIREDDPELDTQGSIQVLGNVGGQPVDFVSTARCTLDTNAAGEATLKVVAVTIREIPDRAGAREAVFIILETRLSDIRTGELPVAETTPPIDAPAGSVTLTLESGEMINNNGTYLPPTSLRVLASGSSGSMTLQTSASPVVLGTSIQGTLDAVIRDVDTPSGFTCPELFECIRACEEDACRDACVNQSNTDAVNALSALTTCAADCSGDQTCFETECREEINACYGSTSEGSAEYGEACSATSPCASPWTCFTVGTDVGICTVACQNNIVCTQTQASRCITFEDGSGICFEGCTQASQCSADQECPAVLQDGTGVCSPPGLWNF